MELLSEKLKWLFIVFGEMHYFKKYFPGGGGYVKVSNTRCCWPLSDVSSLCKNYLAPEI